MANYLRTIICDHCNTSLERRHDRIHEGNNFCSLSCRKQWHADNVVESRKRDCETCGTEFTPRQQQLDMGQGRFCSIQCSTSWLSKQPRTDEWRKAISDGQQGKVVPSGPENPSWKGGRYQDADGYFRVLVSPNTYRAEQRVLMEEHIGRKLTSEEIVHHINHDPSDNRISNLQIVTRSEHAKIHHACRFRSDKGIYETQKIQGVFDE